MRKIITLISVSAAIALPQAPVSAQNLTKADNTTSLNFATSYVENLAPSSNSTITINNTLTTSRTAGVASDVSVFGFQMNALPVSGAPRAFTISGGNGTLTIGAGGITKATDTSALTLANTVALSANQTWTVNAAAGTGTGSFALNLPEIIDNGYNLTIGGAGRLDITRSGTVNLTDRVNLNTGSVIINSSTTIVNLGNASTGDNFQIIKGRAIGSALGNFGVASSFGDGGTNTAIIMGGGVPGDNGFFEYTGANVSSNRTFNFDRRQSGSEIRNTNANSTLTLSGNIQNSQGTQSVAGDSAYSFGGVGNIVLSGDQQLKDNTTAGNRTILNKNGTGTLTITGNNSNSSDTTGTYGAATNVNAGTLIVSGTGSINSTSGIFVATGAAFRYDSTVALTKAVSVGSNGTLLVGGNVSSTITLASGSQVGGDGTVSNLSLGSGVRFVFSLTDTLSVTGTATLDSSFDVASLVNANGTSVDWSSVAAGTYALISNSASFSSVGNFGVENAEDIGGGKIAYFTGASGLNLVVIPEPSTYAFAILGLLGLAAFLRHRHHNAA